MVCNEFDTTIESSAGTLYMITECLGQRHNGVVGGDVMMRLWG